jgi:multidrug efflux pump subunit AcrA (membrane-fusion protein)
MIARVRVVQSVRGNALVLPEEVVQRVDRDRLVVYLEDNGVARERVVQTGGRASDSVEIVSGLKAGDRVIISGYRNLADGQSVTVME